jgi:hypothetical protein
MGEDYSIIILKDGKIFSTGKNNVKYFIFKKKNGQLGIGSNFYSINNFQQFINNNLLNNEIFSTKTYSIINIRNMSCNGINKYDKSVCSGYGNCLNDKCECFFGYLGNNCEFTSCYDISSNDPNVCSRNGVCTNLNTCQCNKNYTGDNCEFFNCFEIFYNDTKVCRSRGKCISPNMCQCKDN